MCNVIDIRLSEDLPTKAQNKLRYVIELGLWRAHFRRAVELNDYNTMDRLNADYERVGLP